MDLPPWVAGWCRAQLGADPAAVLHRSTHMSEVLGLRLTDGREVAIKARPSQHGRERACVEVQGHLAAAGYPCAAPLTAVTQLGGAVVHAEEWRPFTAEELEVAWAASLWLALHNARGEALWDWPPVALAAVREQGAERLRRAGA